jgi:drug/metabolite transporter (DMT)-like permease
MAVLLILAVIFYAIFIILVSRAAGKLDDSLGGFIFNGIGALVPLAIFAAMKFGEAKNMLPTTKNGVLLSVLAGVSVGIFTIIIMRIFQKGSLGYVMPVVYGGAVLLSSVAGWLWFNANINTLQVAGLLLVVAGIILVGVSRTA